MIELGDLDYQDITTDLLGYEPETHDMKNIRYECPYCRSYHKKFYLDTTRGLYNCYNCGEKGNIIKLVRDMLECTFPEALDYLKDWGMEAQDVQTIVSKTKDDSIDNKSLYESILTLQSKDIDMKKQLEPVPLPTDFKYLTDNFNNPEAYPYFGYLKSRGVTLDQIKYYHIGYVVEGFTQGTKIMHVSKSIIFPTYNDSNEVIYWNTRSIVNKKEFKTINSPNDEYEYSKRDVVFNLNEVKQGSSVVVAESVFNALTITLPPSIIGLATFGKEATQEQLELIKGKIDLINKIFLFLDTDAKSMQYRVAERLVKLGIPANKIYLVNNPYTNQDINDLGTMKAMELVGKAKPMKSVSTQLDYILNS